MSDLSDEKREKLISVIERLTKVLNRGDWSSRMVLKVSHRRLSAIKDKLEALINKPVSKEAALKNALRPDQIYVYLSIFQQDGSDLKGWSYQLSMLQSIAVGRAIYQQQDQVEAYVRSRPDPSKEAYVKLRIQKSSILSDESRDANGFALLRIRRLAIQPNCIERFVTGKGDHYLWRDGYLELVESLK
jgi:hypothetical protein